MILAYQYKLNPNNKQISTMSSWLDMLRAHYNYCLRDRIESYEQVKYPKEGNYSDIRTKAECCPLTCSISNDSASRNKEKFVCTNCGFIADADNQAAINIGKKGLEILGLSLSQLLGVTQQVTLKPELCDSFRSK